VFLVGCGGVVGVGIGGCALLSFGVALRLVDGQRSGGSCRGGSRCTAARAKYPGMDKHLPATTREVCLPLGRSGVVGLLVLAFVFAALLAGSCCRWRARRLRGAGCCVCRRGCVVARRRTCASSRGRWCVGGGQRRLCIGRGLLLAPGALVVRHSTVHLRILPAIKHVVAGPGHNSGSPCQIAYKSCIVCFP
jgi:hypothetical protein